MKNSAEDIVINGVTISGLGGIKKFSQELGISEKEVMTQQQKALIFNNPQFVKQVDTIGFKSDGDGTWTLDTKIGGGQINGSESHFGFKEYEANVWNATYNS